MSQQRALGGNVLPKGQYWAALHLAGGHCGGWWHVNRGRVTCTVYCHPWMKVVAVGLLGKTAVPTGCVGMMWMLELNFRSYC